MKNLLSLLLLAAMPLLPMKADAKHHDSSRCEKPDPEFGYFYITHDELVEGCFGTVAWTDACSVNTDDIFISDQNIDQIVLKKKGYYLATYTITGSVASPASAVNPAPGSVYCEKFQFALYLNEGDQPIPGSTYAGNTQSVLDQASDVNSESVGGCATEVVGQVIFRVNEKDSVLQLVNQSENSVRLDSEAGTNNCSKFGPNVSASIAIQRLSNLQID